MDSIAKTSLLTAAMRAAETKRSDVEGRLFNDPYAEILAGEEGMNLRLKAIEASGDQPAIAVRTSFIDLKINESVKSGIKQIVILAAGMDTRAYRMEFPQNLQIFELDRPDVITYKKDKLKTAKSKCKLTSVPVDLTRDWTDLLFDAGFDRELKTLWLVEGLLMYLDAAQVSVLMERINSVAVADDFILFDILGKSLLDSPPMKPQLQFLASMGAPWKFGVDEPEQFMQELDWNVTATMPGEYMPSRWPFPVPPRNIPNVPRSFFVFGSKN